MSRETPLSREKYLRIRERAQLAVAFYNARVLARMIRLDVMADLYREDARRAAIRYHRGRS